MNKTEEVEQVTLNKTPTKRFGNAFNWNACCAFKDSINSSESNWFVIQAVLIWLIICIPGNVVTAIIVYTHWSTTSNSTNYRDYTDIKENGSVDIPNVDNAHNMVSIQRNSSLYLSGHMSMLIKRSLIIISRCNIIALASKFLILMYLWFISLYLI